MKKVISSGLLLLFLAVTFVTDTPPPGWYQQSLPVNKTINDLYFIDSLKGWVVTTGGSNATDTAFILNTTDGGNNWTIQKTGIEVLNAVQFLDANNGYACGNLYGSIFNSIYKTTNGGNNWITLNNISGGGIEDIYFVNKDTGWVCDDFTFGGLYKTTNGGMNWTQQLDGSYRPKRLFFLNNDTGWVSCNMNKLYRTTNSGGNWNQIYNFSYSIRDIFFNDKDTGWIVGGSYNGIVRSNNGGFSWDTVNSPPITDQPKISIFNNKIGWVGAVFNKIIATKDGYNWGYQTTPSFSNFSVQLIDTSRVWAGTSSLIHTTDGGGPITYIGIKSSSTFVSAFDLKQNYPNPFNPATKIMFDVKKNSRISLKVYTIEGREVDELLDYEKFDGGNSYYVDFDAGNLSSGVYLYQMTGWTDDKKEIFIDTKKMVLIK